MAIDNNESYYNNLLLENLGNSIPVVRTTEALIRPILEKNASKSSCSGISALEKFIDRKYDEAALNQLKHELLSEIKQHIDKMENNKQHTDKIENNNYLSDYIKSLHDQIQSLKSEVVFLRTELSTSLLIVRPERNLEISRQIFTIMLKIMKTKLQRKLLI